MKKMLYLLKLKLCIQDPWMPVNVGKRDDFYFTQYKDSFGLNFIHHFVYRNTFALFCIRMFCEPHCLDEQNCNCYPK